MLIAVAISVAWADMLHLLSFEYWSLQDHRPCFDSVEPPPHTLDLFAAVGWKITLSAAVDGRMDLA